MLLERQKVGQRGLPRRPFLTEQGGQACLHRIVQGLQPLHRRPTGGGGSRRPHRRSKAVPAGDLGTEDNDGSSLRRGDGQEKVQYSSCKISHAPICSWFCWTSRMSGTATTTSSPSCCSTSSRVAGPIWCPPAQTGERVVGGCGLLRGGDPPGHRWPLTSEHAGLLIARHWYGYVVEGQMATVQRWLGSLPEEMIAHDAALALVKAWTCALGGRREESDRFLHSQRASLTKARFPTAPSLWSRAWPLFGPASAMVASITWSGWPGEPRSWSRGRLPVGRIGALRAGIQPVSFRRDIGGPEATRGSASVDRGWRTAGADGHPVFLVARCHGRRAPGGGRVARA